MLTNLIPVKSHSLVVLPVPVKPEIREAKIARTKVRLIQGAVSNFKVSPFAVSNFIRTKPIFHRKFTYSNRDFWLIEIKNLRLLGFARPLLLEILVVGLKMSQNDF